MSDMKKDQLDWVTAVKAYLGVSSNNALAVKAGLDPSLVQKPFNPNYKGKFGADTLQKIADAAGLRVMEFPTRPAGMQETEAARFVYDTSANAIDSNIDRAVRELIRGRSGRDPWVNRSHALELAGILPGDILIVDMNLQPRPKDVVCAQIYSRGGVSAETVFRIYEPPYLVTQSLRYGTQKPVPVDGNDVVILGVVDGMLRRRH